MQGNELNFIFERFMIPERIEALFHFIDYLDSRKKEYLNIYIPLCEVLRNLDVQRSMLNPTGNYLDKLKYDNLQREIAEKYKPIEEEVLIPFMNKLRELKIWAGDDILTSIWNNNVSDIIEFKQNFEAGDIEKVIQYKIKYLTFRTETNSDLLSLKFVLNNLDEIYKQLFDFFKDTSENEFESFEAKIIEVNSITDAAEKIALLKHGNIKFSLPTDDFFSYQNLRPYYPEFYQQSPTINNEFIMGNKISVRDIIGHGNTVNAGNDVHVNATVHVTKGNLESLKEQLTKHGVEDEDINELTEIVQSEQPNSENNTLGEKSNGWILKVAGKALSGIGKIATGISSNLLASIIRQYYGMP